MREPLDPTPVELRVEYAGEWLVPDPSTVFAIGREGDLAIDDNPFLHRRFLEISFANGMWWIANVGSRIAATVSAADGTVQSWLSPGARLPVVFAKSTVVFSAGPTTYEVTLDVADPAFSAAVLPPRSTPGETTVMPVGLTLLQRALVVALAEPMLRREGVGMSELPSNAAAAERLGWSLTKFNRKLDNVCDKLDRMGVQGLRGGAGALASNRRARLVEYAVMSQLVARSDLAILDDPSALQGD